MDIESHNGDERYVSNIEEVEVKGFEKQSDGPRLQIQLREIIKGTREEYLRKKGEENDN